MKPAQKLIAGNWKMHGLRASVDELDAVIAKLPPGVDVSIHPPLTLLALFAERAGDAVIIGAQDVAPGAFGARTGDVSAAMLVDAGARAVIVGHSERRHYHCEACALIRTKAEAARAAGLLTILCVGESESERLAGEALAVIEAQLACALPRGPGPAIAVAYEPIWAVGTGVTPTMVEIAEVHAAIRRVVPVDTRILYGGSVKAANAAEILGVPNVDGALVGGASLVAAEFLAVIAAGARAAR